MKESNTLAANANTKQLQGVVLLNIREEFMSESNTLAVNAANIFLGREIFLNIKGEYTKAYEMLLYTKVCA